MLTIRAMSNGAGYAARHLAYSDYLHEEGKIKGLWSGKAAERLGLTGEVSPEQFERLRECQSETGEFLRQRHSADRFRADGSKQSNGIHFFDLVFSAPKSVSIMAVLEDPRLFKAHDTAVSTALAEAEHYAAAEDQRKGKKLLRETGNLAIATYQHHASRQLDMQLHGHAVVFNLTYDESSEKWKALNARGLYERRKYLTAVYRNSLAYEVKKLGYEIENRTNDRGTDQVFEIKQVSPALCKQFSKRSAEKETAIKEFITENGRTPSDNEVAVLVRNTREDKLRKISTKEVKAHQRAQLSPKDAKILARTREQAAAKNEVPCLTSAAPSLEYAVEHLFERVSVVCDHELLTEALHHGRGQIDLNALKAELGNKQRSGAIIGAHGQVATKESLEREQKTIGAINRGNGCYEMFLREDRNFELSDALSEEQKKAAKFILRSKDFATCLQGAAGTGKTDTLREIKRGLIESGHDVAAGAPTQAAVRELEQRGFQEAFTIERLLTDTQMQEGITGKVLIVDEAGMVSGRQMEGLIDVVEKANGRLLLVGDTQQIKAIQASDALRILQKESKLKTATLREVKRQIEPEYRKTSKTLWKDREKGFEMLEKMGAVQSVDYLARPHATVDAFMEAKKQLNINGREGTVLVISPTHHEIDRYSAAIRNQLKSEARLSNGTNVDRFEALNWTTAQRKDIQRYEPGQVLVFHKAVKNVRRREQLTVLRTEDSKLIARNAKGKEVAFTGKQAGAFGVFARQTIEVACGDQLLLQANHKQRGLEITNGDVALVKSVDNKGRIHLDDGRTLPTNYRQFKYGYAMTAHRSQGKSADAVIVSADKMDGDLFYVAVSRGRQFVKVLTSNLPLLRESVTWDSTRQSATELVRETERKEKQKERRTAQAQKAAREWQRKIFTNLRNARTHFITSAFGHQKAGSAVSER
jgi:conjugative relaxase-like TrwC/TraI family protein